MNTTITKPAFATGIKDENLQEFSPKDNKNILKILEFNTIHKVDELADNVMEIMHDLFSSDSQLENPGLRQIVSDFLLAIFASFSEYSDSIETDAQANLASILIKNKLTSPGVIEGLFDSVLLDLGTSINSVDGEQRAYNIHNIFFLRDAFAAIKPSKEHSMITYYRNKIELTQGCILIEHESLWVREKDSPRIRLVDEDAFIEAEFDSEVFVKVESPVK